MAAGLRRRAVDVLTASEAGLLGAPDEEVLARSTEEGRVLVTQDGDFLRLHGRLRHAGIVYSVQGLRSIGELIAALGLIHDVLSPDEVANEVQFI